MRAALLLVATVALATLGIATTTSAHHRHGARDPLGRVNHIVVIYQENHSFDNLYGRWEHVDGIADADAAHTRQVDQNGAPFACLLQNDANLTAPDPLSGRCGGGTSHFFNAPFPFDDYIPPSAKTCPDPAASSPPNGVRHPNGLPGGCTRDLVHRYYQEQYQLNGGRQNRYTTGSDAVGLTQGYYDTRALPIYRYLHARNHPPYAISDAFFQAAFGGSFLNHQWLIAARTPWFDGAPPSGAPNDQHSATDTNAMPKASPLYTPTTAVTDAALTDACPSATPARHDSPPRTGAAHGNAVCGDWAVNTTQPPYQPYAPGTAPERRLPPQDSPTIGDRLSAKGVDWAWYSGGWSNADGRRTEPGWTNGSGPVTRGANTQACPEPASNPKATWPNCPDALFQYHHQPFNYFRAYAPGTQARAQHLRDEQELIAAARGSTRTCDLRSVSFIKPAGAENEHPGYASEPNGSDHLVALLQAIESGACARDTMIVVTYDEFGGAWDHVPPPGQGAATPGPHDAWGPGTRIPTLTIAPFLRGDFVVDRQSHDTTSIMATIEHRFGLAPVGSRDAAVADMSSVFTAGAGGRRGRGDGGRPR